MATLKITFTPASPAPNLGYRVKYREVGTTAWIYVTPNPTSSPVLIPGVPNGKLWEGTIESQCSNNKFSIPRSFTIDNRPPCTQYTIVAGSTGANIDWMGCDGVPQSHFVPPNEQYTLCTSDGLIGATDGMFDIVSGPFPCSM
jgi:hypothetical protein